jgi:hypothetical protein
MNQILEKTIISKYKGDFWDLKNLKKFYLAHQNLFVLRSLSIRRTILSPPRMVQSKFFLTKT